MSISSKGRSQGFRQLVEDHREQRLEVLSRILEEYQKRSGDLAAAITEEMGAPKGLAVAFRWDSGRHLNTAIEVLKKFKFEEQRGATLIVKEPIGVCGMITPWNWPINQVTVKVFPRSRPAAPWCSSRHKSRISRPRSLPRFCMQQACPPACSI